MLINFQKRVCMTMYVYRMHTCAGVSLFLGSDARIDTCKKKNK